MLLITEEEEGEVIVQQITKKKKNQSINKNTSTNPTNNHPRLLKQITQLKIKKNLQNTKVIARHPTNYDNLNNS